MRQWALPLAFALFGLAPVAWGQADLREGVARYHYYQNDYLPALSELMVAREQGALGADEGAVHEGAIRMAFGMSASAERLLESALSGRPKQRDAARFYLGKLHYLRGDWAQATDAWARVGDALDPDLARERRALEWQWRLRTGQPDPVDPRVLWDQLDEWAPVVLYNLGGAFARAGDRVQARRYYQALIDGAPRRQRQDAEYLALRDRANTALGFSALLAQDFERAEQAFDRVRLTREDADQALLGYGWAALERGQPARAVRIWQALSERSLTGSAAQEALVALPYAYTQLDASQAALDAYDRADARLEEELARVGQLRQQLTPAYLRRQLAATDLRGTLSLEGRENWLTLTESTVAASADPYLSDWVNQSPFQSQVQALSDLRDQAQLLADWPEKLAHYGQLLRDKRALRTDRQAEVARRQLWTQAEQLRERRAPLAARLSDIEARADYLALADDETRRLYERVEAALERADRLTAAGELENPRETRARLALYRGILLWRAAQDYPDRLWRVRKQQRDLDRALAQLRTRQDRVRSVIADNPDIEPALARIAERTEAIARQRQRLDEAQQRQAEQLADNLQTHLAQHQARLTQYLSRVRLGAARLQDRALRDQGGTP
ncbi:hypothetical protein OOT55_12625 [Marinimicrobium sp. C6131]|uniref:tetratricopeptide repeat protein n=1 Tax=Marinimicrobium sp. C6131 TaxID=3022676 RepID=UPI00223C9F01|nr:tetratricopeptide repeat protein [Marinimicrobium sp. C6131]UZJ43496.1 hypothetical protein OOT55_12625 [Marinimicrobium sp. C6131]